MGGGHIFLKTRRDVSFIKVLWNEPTFGLIHLAGQYLETSTGEQANGKLNLANSAAVYLALHSPLVLILLRCALMTHLILRQLNKHWNTSL